MYQLHVSEKSICGLFGQQLALTSQMDHSGYSIMKANHMKLSGIMKQLFNSCHFADHILRCIFSCDQAALRTLLSICPSVRLSVRPSVTPFSLCSHHRIIKLLPMTKVMSMQKVKVRGQRSRSQRSRPNLAVSRL